MRRSTLARVSALGGIGLLAGAAIIRFGIVPTVAVLPADTDTTRSYEGTIHSLLNTEALAAGDLANLMIRDLPITIERHVAVTEVSEGAALVNEQNTVLAPDGSPVLATETRYAIDRSTMASTDAFADEGVVDSEGLVIGWPIGTEARDYEGWSSDLQRTVTASYAGHDERGGIDVAVFEVEVANERIVNPALLGQFPPALPKAQIAVFASVLGVDEAVLANLEPMLAQLPDEVPLAYLYSVDTTYYVDQTTGVVVDLERDETRSVALDVEGLSGLPIAAVYDVSYQGAADSVAVAVEDARDAGSKLNLLGTTLPLLLTIAGVVLLVAAAVVRRDRRPDADAVLPPVERELVGSH